MTKPFGIPFWLGVVLFVAIATFFLWEEHKAHILGAVIWLPLLACPLIHFFMHRGHGGDRGDHSHQHHDGDPQ